MASYIIAGQADDAQFARAEYAAKQIEAACPNVFFHFEMKHPNDWKEFIVDVFRKYDFHTYPDDFAGPLIWTHEGDCVGSTFEFVQRICVEKFGISNPPSHGDPIFRQIAADNLKQVRLQQQRQQHGAPFVERCEEQRSLCAGASLLAPRVFDEKRRTAFGPGAVMEVWASRTLASESRELREAYGSGQPVTIDARLQVGTMGAEKSHVAILHPQPLAPKHLILVPGRDIREVVEDGDSLKVRSLAVPPCSFCRDHSEDIGLQHFNAIAEALVSFGAGAVATFTGLRGGEGLAAEYRHPLDTHVQILPFPLGGDGESPLRYPLELHIERAEPADPRQSQDISLKAFQFEHVFKRFGNVPADDKSKTLQQRSEPIAKAALALFEAARGASTPPRDSFMLAMTTSWLLLVPLEVPELASARHEVWLRLPPPPALALCGVVVCRTPETGYPETAGLTAASLAGGRKGGVVSTRALEEEIRPETPEFEAASREVRIAAGLLDMPADILGVWARPAASRSPRR